MVPQDDLQDEHLTAVQLLTDRFAMRSDDVQKLLELASGNQLLVESALLVAKELGGSPYEKAQRYLHDVLQPPSINKKT
jgi:hypothetical protein